MFHIRVANLNIEIQNRYPYAERFCREFFADFHEPDITVFVTDEELAAREMFPLTRDRVISKSLKAYAKMVSSADKGGVRIIE